MLLTTTGRRSGEPRTTPMMFHRDGDRVLVIASNIGAAPHPDWYLNLVADPHVTVEIGDEAYPAIATPTEGADRERVWAMIKERYPFFADHEKATHAHDPGGGAHPGDDRREIVRGRGLGQAYVVGDHGTRVRP